MNQLIISIANSSIVGGREKVQALVFNPSKIHENMYQHKMHYTDYNGQTNHYILETDETPLASSCTFIKNGFGKLKFGISGVSSIFYIYKDKLDEFVTKIT